MTWEAIKNVLVGLMPEAFNQQFVSQTGAPSELELYARITNQEIASYPHKFSFQEEEYTLTLNSTGEYDLATLIPGYGVIKQIYGGSAYPGQPVGIKPLTEYNSHTGGIMAAMKSKSTLLLRGLESGTIKIVYYSKYLVKDSTGSRKLDFEDDDDYSVLENSQVLIEGIMRFAYRKKHKKPYTQKYILPTGDVVELEPFQYMLIMEAMNDTPTKGYPTDIRF